MYIYILFCYSITILFYSIVILLQLKKPISFPKSFPRVIKGCGLLQELKNEILIKDPSYDLGYRLNWDLVMRYRKCAKCKKYKIPKVVFPSNYSICWDCAEWYTPP
jgi:hypothetical protein